MSARAARELLERHGLAASKELGQNFLCDEAQADKLVRLAEVGAGDAVLEIGTGLGILTRALAEQARAVTTIEIDAGLVRALRAESVLPANARLLHADALAVDLGAEIAALAADGARVRVVANLPYSVATPLMRRFLDLAPRLAGWAVMIQREVALRIGAQPGSRDYGSFAVLHQLVARVRIGLALHPQCFYPAPGVTSSFVLLTPHAEYALRPGELERVERLVRAAFAHRRKTLVNSLRQSSGIDPVPVAAWLARSGLDERTRAEALAPAQWLALAREALA
ncbi:MAG: ribosomal RNA small subunit methyltransferase A [Deltaproteobacteria bacterium]|nr:ribosomal RNA small subunit methyltransferase A [Deltaproteobacteria bacterium]